jgi:23S rRNA pseudouridine1911/1915/1917 synthase
MAKPGIEIIYQNNEIVVINKPSGVSVTADRSGDAELVDILGEQVGPQEASRLRLVHRLDKDTSGAMILAKNTQTQSRLSSYFEKKLIRKTYLALVTGAVPGREGTIDAPLAHCRAKAQLMCVDRKKGKEAVTQWRLLADFGAAALLSVNPVTGRTHQVRVHLAGIGTPLAIDRLYGSSQPLFLSDFKPDYRLGKGQAERPLIERLTLHAYQIELPKPRTTSSVIPAKPVLSRACAESGRSVEGAGIHTCQQPSGFDCFVARLDKKFAACIKMFAKHNPKGFDAFINRNDLTSIMGAERLC